MKKVIALAFVAMAAVGCSQTEKGAATGAAAGAVVGGIVSGNVQGAAVGAAIGGVGGALLGAATEPGRCYYRDRYGRRYVDECPAGYR